MNIWERVENVRPHVERDLIDSPSTKPVSSRTNTKPAVEPMALQRRGPRDSMFLGLLRLEAQFARSLSSSLVQLGRVHAAPSALFNWCCSRAWVGTAPPPTSAGPRFAEAHPLCFGRAVARPRCCR